MKFKSAINSSIFPIRFNGLLGSIVLIVMAICPVGSALDQDDCGNMREPQPGISKIFSEDGIARFPFDIFRGDIRFECTVNGHEVHLLLDDGFMWDQLLFWGGAIVDSLGFKYEGEIKVSGSPGEEGTPSRLASGVAVGFPGAEIANLDAVVMPSDAQASLLWAGSAGQISACLFKNFIVDINFDEMMITLTAPDRFVYKGGGKYIPWKQLGNGPRSLPATLGFDDGREVSLDLLIDLGYNDQLQLVAGKEHNIPIPDKTLDVSIFDVQGIRTPGLIGRLSRIEIAGYKIENLMALYLSGENGEELHYGEGLIGLGLMSRFNLVYDFHGQKIYFEPNKYFGDPFEYDMSGMVLGLVNESNHINILAVRPDSPAGEAGLVAGDEILNINGRLPGDIDSNELDAILRKEGSNLRLLIGREKKELEISLNLRRLI